MKKSIFTIVAFVFAASAFGQFTEQGTFLVGGSSNLGLSFLSNKFKSGGSNFIDGPTTSSFSIAPQVGYFVVNNLAVGAGLDFSSGKLKNDNLEVTSSSLVFGPFARYYFDKFYAEGEFSIGSSKSDDGDGEVKDNISGWSLAAGYALLLSDAVSLEPRIGYGSTSLKDPDSDFVSKNAGLFVNLSLFVYLSK